MQKKFGNKKNALANKDVLKIFGNYSFTPPSATPAMMNLERNT